MFTTSKMLNQAAILAILCISASAAVFRQPIHRIVGGKPVSIEDIPYQVSVNFFGQHLCGGSILSERFILTAAHCIIGATPDFTVRTGSNYSSTDGEVHKVRQIISHELYDEETTDYDFSIFELEDPITFSDTRRAVQLPEADEDIADGTVLKVSGWGDTKNHQESNYHVRTVSVPKVNQLECQANYIFGAIISEQMFCAGYQEGGKDSCQGDSGGPVVDDNNVQHGVVSWGKGCALPSYPGVYAKVSAVRNWIREISNV
uniref:trypsin n=1 Tax=Lutzomyia longipalpis TaxID=7200 RepID=A0A1B0GHB6_LUTLO